MLKSIKIYITSVLLVFTIPVLFFSDCFAQADTIALQLNQQKFDVQEWNELRSEPEFNYHPQANAFFDWLGEIFGSFLRSLFSKDFKMGNTKWIDYVIYAIAIAIFIWFLIKVIKADKGWLFCRSKEAEKQNPVFTEEDIQGSNLDEAIAKAIKDEDYRLAVRYLFLSNLSNLNSLQLIQWAPDKTNRDYSRELKKKEYSETFKENASAFERIWYGEYIPDKHLFEKLREDFRSFDRRVAR
ncbi:MAG: hypothetical protein J7604_15040 [Sporocytophaga sp.]|uniref:hypothetical protein n=1 Tax=Sporocytophaga sp. TaxID=2231183 RepID=UPI001B0C3BD6|nr:hypothetical protein [Sporocytophaga sp.]MBO9701524.1 hypothetical protein [Sporocytophaga sp.]